MLVRLALTTPFLLVKLVSHPMSSISVTGVAEAEVSFYTPANLRCRRRIDLEAEDVEVVWLELHLLKKTLLFGTIYRPPNVDKRVLDSIIGMLDRVAQEQKEVVLTGDFNCDMLKPQPSVAAKELLTSTEVLNLSQLITNPTRVTKHSASLIDLLFTTNLNMFLSVGTASVTGSDHQMIYGVCREKLLLTPTVSYIRSFKYTCSILNTPPGLHAELGSRGCILKIFQEV